MIWTIWQPLLLVILTIIFQECLTDEKLAQLMKEKRIIPLIIDKAPKHKCEMYYRQNSEELVYVEPGQRMRDYETNKIPHVEWPVEPETIYTLYMLGFTPMDPEKYWVETVEGYDYNTHGTRPPVLPEVQQWEQWIVINIPFNNITGGDEILPYLYPRVPEVNVTEHYVMLIYAQPCRIAMASSEMKNYMGYIFGPHHTVRRFTERYSLGHPWAGNFFYALKKDIKIY